MNMNTTIYTETDCWIDSPTTSVTENVGTNYFVSYCPDKKKQEFRKQSCMNEFIALHGIQKSLSELSKKEDVTITHHFEDTQDDGDFHFRLGEGKDYSSELKVNPNALKTGYFDVEFFRMGDQKISGVTKTIQDEVEYFFFALPEFDPQQHIEKFRKYSNRFYFCKSVDLWDTIVDFKNRKRISIRMNFDKRNPACLASVPLDCDVFKCRELYWHEFKNMDEPKIFNKIF